MSAFSKNKTQNNQNKSNNVPKSGDTRGVRMVVTTKNIVVYAMTSIKFVFFVEKKIIQL